MIKKIYQDIGLIIFLSIFLSGCHSSDNTTKKPAPLFENLGHFHREIHTESPRAQRYFDQGLILFYSFEYGESIRSFKAATEIDPKCAMCYWGLALALGSKTVMPLTGHELQDAQQAIESAKKWVDPQNVRERAYIDALARRYSSAQPKQLETFAGLCSSYSQISGDKTKDFANAMQQVVKLFPEDNDAKVLLAASLFDVTKWDFWTHSQKPKPYTLEIIKILEYVLAKDIYHPGANHLYVHITEFSPYPDRALQSALRLHRLVPGSEHMAHMPCHTYFMTGRYHEAILMNQLAIEIYKKYSTICQAQGFTPEIQYLYFHNFDFLISAASMIGQKNIALIYAKQLAEEGKQLADKDFTLQKMLTPQILVPLLFGDWKTVLNFPKPNENHQYVLAIWHYARAMAEIQLNQMEAAQKDFNQLKNYADQGASNQNLAIMGATLLKIASEILQGEFAYRTGNIETMKQHFTTAIKLQDNMHSIDPPLWYFPVRQLLGAALLKTKQAGDAKIIFAADLKKHPQNGWSLYGLMQAEKLLGNMIAAEKTKKQFRFAWQYADMKEPVFPL